MALLMCVSLTYLTFFFFFFCVLPPPPSTPHAHCAPEYKEGGGGENITLRMYEEGGRKGIPSFSIKCAQNPRTLLRYDYYENV